MEKRTITLLMDGKVPITTDKETFELVKLMVTEAGAVEDRSKLVAVIRRFIAENQLYAHRRGHVISLAVLACRELKDSPETERAQ